MQTLPSRPSSTSLAPAETGALTAALPDFPLDPEQVKGFLHPDEGRALYHLAGTEPDIGPAMEIGSYCGKSTLYLGYGCQSVGRILFTLDHHEGSEEQQPGQQFHDPELLDADSGRLDTLPSLRRNLRQAGLMDTAVPLLAHSQVAAAGWTGHLGLLFIDGGHSFAAAGSDYRLWVPRLAAGGYLAIHDIFRDPSRGGQAPVTLLRRALSDGSFQMVAQVQTLAILKRQG